MIVGYSYRIAAVLPAYYTLHLYPILSVRNMWMDKDTYLHGIVSRA